MERRTFLRIGTIGCASWGVSPSLFLEGATAAESIGAPPILVKILLRGAMDGLAAVQPVNDPHLSMLRPSLALPVGQQGEEGRAIDLGTGHALHPSLAPLLPLWGSGELAIIHGVGSPHTSRSHFDAQDFMESGTPGDKNTTSGWLARAAEALPEPSPDLLHAVALSPSLPRSLYGHASAIAVERLEAVSLRAPRTARRAARMALNRQDSANTGIVGRAWSDARSLLSEIDSLPETGRDKSFPKTGLGQSLQDIARLVRADVGLRIAFAEMGDWDTHVQQGSSRGRFATQARDLAEALAAFWASLGSHRSRVVVVATTEFGRTVRENGGHGTDHGRGSCAFVLGTHVQGSQMLGTLPSLAPENLEDGRDLPVTTDFRQVFATITREHLGIEQGLFPGWEGPSLPIFRT